MRVLVPILIVLGVLYIWDVNYNNGVLTAGVTSSCIFETFEDF